MDPAQTATPDNDGSVSTAVDLLEKRFSEPSETNGKEEAGNGGEREQEDPNANEPETGAEGGEDGAEGAEPEEGSSEESPSGEGEGEEYEPSGDEPTSGLNLSDDQEIEVNGHKTTFGALKALAGQDQALRERAQQVIQAQQQVQAIAERHVSGLKQIEKIAQAQWDELMSVDVAAFKAKATPEEWAAFSKLADQRFQALQDVQNSLKQVEPEVTEAQRQKQVQDIQACAKALTDPATGIPGYNHERWEADKAFAVSLGADPSYLDTLADPVAWRIINLAARQAQAEKAVKEVKPKPVVKTTTKPALRTKADNDGGKPNRDAMNRLRQTGSPKDAIAVLASRLGAE